MDQKYLKHMFDISEHSADNTKRTAEAVEMMCGAVASLSEALDKERELRKAADNRLDRNNKMALAVSMCTLGVGVLAIGVALLLHFVFS